MRTVKEVLKKFRGRALLCDEVGLGKTIEACTVMMEYIIRGFARRILILVPPSLVNQWSDELRRKFNQNFITSDDPRFKDMGDEAHHLKNRKTVAWNFIKSGELMEPKNIEKLRALVSDVMVRNKRSDVNIKFTKRYAETIEINLSAVEKKFYDLISEFVRCNYNQGEKGMSRFTLKIIQEELGSSVYCVIPTLKKLLDGRKISMKNKKYVKKFIGIAENIETMKYEENTKGKKLMDIINDFNDKIIVFTKYKTTVKFLEKLLKQNGYKTAVFYGGMTRREKDGQIENFRNESQILLSTETGYSLIYVVIPYERKDIFGKTELKLCFDSDFSKNLTEYFMMSNPNMIIL